MKIEFSQQIFETYSKYQRLCQSIQWEPSRSMPAYGWTDVTKLIVAVRNFANAPKNNRCLFWDT